MAAAAMWTIWVLAYLTGMSAASWFAAYHHGAPGSLSAAADQQIAVAILWAVPALCFLPVIYVMVIAWLGGTASSAGNERPAASSSAPARLASPAPRLAFTAHPAVKTSRRTRAIGMKPKPDTSGPHRRRPKPVHKVGVADGDSQLALCCSGLCSRRPNRSARAGNSQRG